MDRMHNQVVEDIVAWKLNLYFFQVVRFLLLVAMLMVPLCAGWFLIALFRYTDTYSKLKAC